MQKKQKLSKDEHTTTPPAPPPNTGKGGRVYLGRITTAHGIKGMVRIEFFGDDPQSLERFGPLFTGPDNNLSLQVHLKSKAGNLWLAEIAGITTRNDAEGLRGTSLWIDRAKLPALKKEGQLYQTDLIGINVFDTSGQAIGKIIAVPNFGAGDLLEIKPEHAESFYIPFAKDFIVKTDLNAGIVTVTNVGDFMKDE